MTDPRSIAALDVAERHAGHRVNHAEAFDADLAISTGELAQMLPDLLGAMGGEVVRADGGGN